MTTNEGRRGAHRRRNKVLRGAEHHVPYAGDALGPKDVVLVDEGIRFCGERSTTPGTSAAPWGPKTWCLTTKEQGFAGGGAPRPIRRRRPTPRPAAFPVGNRPPKKDRRTVGPPIFPILLNPSGFPKYPARPSIAYFTFRVFVVFQLDCSFFWILACSCQVRAKCSRPLESDWK